GRDNFALQILDGPEGRSFRSGENPPDLAETLLRVNEIGNCFDVRVVFRYPIPAGQTGVENAVFNVAGHLLSPNQHAFNFRIIDGWEITSAAGGNFVTRAPEQIDGGVFQAAFRDAELQRHRRAP